MPGSDVENTALSRGETLALLDAAGLAAHPHAAELWQVTAGDAALVARVIGVLRALPDEAATVWVDDPRIRAVVEEWLTTRMLDADRPSARRLSIATRITWPLADALLGQGAATEGVLLALEGAGVLSARTTEGDEPYFEIAPLVRRVLREELDPSCAAPLHALAADAAYRSRHALEALEHAIAAGDLDRASDFLRRDWVELHRLHAEPTRLLLGELGVAELRAHPFVALQLALASNATPFARARAASLFEIVAEAAERVDARMPAPRRILLRMVATSARRTTGRSEAAAALASAALADLDELPPGELAELAPALATIYAQLGQSLHTGGRIDDALRCFAAAAGRGIADAGSLPGLALQAVLLAEVGELTRADRLLAAVRGARWLPNWSDGFPASSYRVAEAWLAIERLDAPAAHAHLDVLDPYLDSIEQWSPIVRARAMAHLAAGELDAAVAMLRGSARSAQTFDGIPRIEYELTRAFVELSSGEVEVAELLLEPLDGPVADTIRALLRLATGDAECALTQLPGDEVALTPRIAAHRDAIRLAARLRVGDAPEAAAVRVLGEQLLACGLGSPLWMLPPADRQALAVLAVGAPGEAIFRRARTGPVLFRPEGGRALLSPRELVVLNALVHAGSVPRVARQLHVSPNTVKTQLRAIYRKLGVGTREEALDRAGQLGLLAADAGGNG